MSNDNTFSRTNRLGTVEVHTLTAARGGFTYTVNGHARFHGVIAQAAFRGARRRAMSPPDWV